MEWPNGTGVYEGGLRDGKGHGRGMMQYANGNICEGEWMDGQRHCVCKAKFAQSSPCTFPRQGKSYEGEYRNDKRHGGSRYEFANGDVLEGEWKDGKMDGWGTSKAADGRLVYEGEWKDGLRHGRGMAKHTEHRYEGDWKDGKEHGNGTITYSDGGMYEGGWKDGVMHSRGTNKSANGEVLRAGWNMGVVSNSFVR